MFKKNRALFLFYLSLSPAFLPAQPEKKPDVDIPSVTLLNPEKQVDRSPKKETFATESSSEEGRSESLQPPARWKKKPIDVTSATNTKSIHKQFGEETTPLLEQKEEELHPLAFLSSPSSPPAPSSSSNMTSSSPVNLVVQGAYLYWKPSEDTMYLFTSSNFLEKKPLSFSYHSGYQISLGLSGDHNAWLFAARYNQLFFHHKNPSTNSSLPSSWVYSSPTISSLSNIFSLHFQFQSLDLFFSSSYHPRESLQLAPYFGIRGIDFKQDLQNQISYSLNGTSFKGHLHASSFLKQIGPRIGLHSTYRLTKHWDIIADISGSILYSSNKTRFSSLAVGANLPLTLHKTMKSFHPNMDLSLGLNWNIYQNAQIQGVDLFLQYDALFFWKENFLPSLQTNALNNGDLVLQGLTAGLRFQF